MLLGSSSPARLRRRAVADARVGVRACRTACTGERERGLERRFDAGTAVGAVLIGALTATSLGVSGAFAVLAALSTPACRWR